MLPFYKLPKLIQWLIALPLLSLCVLGINLLNLHPAMWLLLSFILPIITFGISPFLKLIGMVTYLSPMVITFGKDIKDYQIHNATTFDYLVNFRWSERGRVAQKKLLTYYFQALLNIIEKIEEGDLPKSVRVVGNSYFFSERTAQKLGFMVSKASFYRKLNSVLNGFELVYLYSFSQGKWTIPRLWQVKKATITGTVLLEKKEYLQSLITKFTTSQPVIHNTTFKK